MNAGRFRSWILAIALAGGVAWTALIAGGADGPASQPDTRPMPSQLALTQPVEIGPDMVTLKELSDLYEPVPFDHKTHAKMAQMWYGCETCHHRTPQPTTHPSTQSSAPLATTLPASHDQSASATVPACKSCHVVSATETDINMPSLKGAYHRQCLNCHKEWMHGNACIVCHKPKDEQSGFPTAKAPTRDDVIGRMHPPIPEPDTKLYKMRFTPADGGNVLFRHKEHTADFGMRCISCHHRDNCAHCHDRAGDKTQDKPLRPGATWSESHGPCMSCHQQDRCQHCHYTDEQTPPAPFRHATTGQEMDKDHEKLSCPQCHTALKTKSPPTCGDSSCHKDKVVSYPAQRPGPVVTTQPSVKPTTRPLAKVRPG